MWITLWKLGISHLFLESFKKNGRKFCGKVDARILVYQKRNALVNPENEKLFDGERQIVVY